MGIENVKKRRIKKVTVSDKGGILLGKLASDYNCFDIYERIDGVIELHPNVKIPARDKWIYEADTKEKVLKAVCSDPSSATVMSVEQLGLEDGEEK